MVIRTLCFHGVIPLSLEIKYIPKRGQIKLTYLTVIVKKKWTKVDPHFFDN